MVTCGLELSEPPCERELCLRWQLRSLFSLFCKRGRILGEAKCLPSGGDSLIPLPFCCASGEGSPWATGRRMKIARVIRWCSPRDAHEAGSKSSIGPHPSPSLFAWNEWKYLLMYSFNIAPASILGVVRHQDTEILGLFVLIWSYEGWRQTWLKLDSVLKRWNWKKAMNAQPLRPHKATSGRREGISF